MVGGCGPMRKVSTMPLGCTICNKNCCLGSGMADHALPRAKACSAGVILLERPLTTVEDSRLWAVWAIPDHGSRAGTTRSEILLPKLSATETARVNKVCS